MDAVGRKSAGRTKLWDELKTVLNGRLPTVEDLPQLPYANMVIKESMRLYPPVAIFGRETVSDYQLDDY